MLSVSESMWEIKGMDHRKWCLIGIPDHIGVYHVGGRVGAAGGPQAFLKIFTKLKGREKNLHSLGETTHLSTLGSDIKENHRQATDAIQTAHQRYGLTVVIGGGHDHAYSHLAGISQAGAGTLGCINIDAHLDVRKPAPVITSGSPFYLALESGVLKPDVFIEFGIQRHCNTPELWKYVEHKGVQVIPFEELRHGQAITAFKKTLKQLTRKCDAIVISLDLDAVSMAFAPGVSAPQAEGFSSSDILSIMAEAGKERKVISLGIFELNPEHDHEDQTARLAATAAYHFIAHALAAKKPKA
jgi:formiminoglutamase